MFLESEMKRSVGEESGLWSLRSDDYVMIYGYTYFTRGKSVPVWAFFPTNKLNERHLITELGRHKKAKSSTLMRW
jgi:hypothetical protein